jgi:hypothetical protein
VPRIDAVRHQPIQQRHQRTADEIGTRDDEMRCPPIDPTNREKSRDLGQPGIERLGVADELAGGLRRQVHRRGYLGGRPGEPGDQRMTGVS